MRARQHSAALRAGESVFCRGCGRVATKTRSTALPMMSSQTVTVPIRRPDGNDADFHVADFDRERRIAVRQPVQPTL